MKKKRNGKRAYVGDIIKTNKNFLPLDKDKRLIDLKGKEYVGIIISRKSSFFGVRFEEGLEFANKLNGLLRNKVGYVLERTEFDVDPTV